MAPKIELKIMNNSSKTLTSQSNWKTFVKLKLYTVATYIKNYPTCTINNEQYNSWRLYFNYSVKKIKLIHIIEASHK